MDTSTNAEGNEPVFNTFATIYKNMAKAHYHPNGPYAKIAEQVRQIISSSSPSNAVIVDLASGHGEPASVIAKEIPTAKVYSTDISDKMHAMARVAASDIPNMEAQIVDMEDLTPFFDDDSVDIVTVCYGYMFPPNKMKAIQETYRVLKPGGTLVATTWNRLQLFEVFEELYPLVLGKPYVSPDSFNPLSLSEPGVFESMLEKAGFKKDTMQVSTDQYPFDLTNELDFYYESVTACDLKSLSESVDPEQVKSTFDELVKKHLEVREDGSVISQYNVYKCIVVQK